MQMCIRDSRFHGLFIASIQLRIDIAYLHVNIGGILRPHARLRQAGDGRIADGCPGGKVAVLRQQTHNGEAARFNVGQLFLQVGHALPNLGYSGFIIQPVAGLALHPAAVLISHAAPPQLQGDGAVSYTHLDVYKRQAPGCA